MWSDFCLFIVIFAFAISKIKWYFQDGKENLVSINFSKYSLAARRTIFFSRYEASQLGHAKQEPEHLALGIIRENKQLFTGQLCVKTSLDEIAVKIRDASRNSKAEKSLSVDLPFSELSQRILEKAKEIAEKSDHRDIILCVHILAAICSVDCLASRILREYGVTEESVGKVLSPIPTN
jgi:ATP-dependent Clp protease ATP-binding subunit ClpC